jgi:hypothetical protein
MKNACVLLALLLASGVLIAQSAVVYSCVAKDGTIRIVPNATSCKGQETLLSWNQVGPQGPTGPQGPQGVPGPTGPQGPAGPSSAGPTVLDQAGRYVGIWWGGLGFADSVLRKINGFTVTLQYYQGGFYQATPGENPHLYYATSNCSGQAYYNVYGGSGVHNGDIVGQFLYFAGTIQQVHIFSYNGGGGPLVCTSSDLGFQWMGPVQAVDASALLALTPPFEFQITAP